MTVSYEMVNELRAEIRRQLALTFTHEGVEMVMNGLAVVNLAEAMRRALEAADAVRGGDGAPPAGTVPVRLAVAMTTLPAIPGVMESSVLIACNDGTWWLWGAENMRWHQIDGPPAPLPAVPEVGAVVEDPTP